MRHNKLESGDAKGRGRPYTPRPCISCKSEASIAVQVLGRTVGLGQGRSKRQVKLSTTVLLCDVCSSRPSTFIERLSAAANDALDHVREHRAA